MEIIRLKFANYQKTSDERSAAVEPLERARVTLMDHSSWSDHLLLAQTLTRFVRYLSGT